MNHIQLCDSWRVKAGKFGHPAGQQVKQCKTKGKVFKWRILLRDTQIVEKHSFDPIGEPQSQHNFCYPGGNLKNYKTDSNTPNKEKGMHTHQFYQGERFSGTSLTVQWLGFGAFTTKGAGSISAWGN